MKRSWKIENLAGEKHKYHLYIDGTIITEHDGAKAIYDFGNFRTQEEFEAKAKQFPRTIARLAGVDVSEVVKKFDEML